MDKILLGAVLVLDGILLGSGIVFSSFYIENEPTCNDGMYYDTTEDGAIRATYIQAEDTCGKE